MAKYFGTDGIRGRYGDPHMCPAFAFRLAKALSEYLRVQKDGQPLNIIVGRDTRQSGEALSDALIAGFNSNSVYVHSCGVIPTPGVARAVIEQRADLGVAITASHNPSRDNGIKLFDSHGYKFSEAQEVVIEEILDALPSAPTDLPEPQSYPLDGSGFYVNYLRSLMDQHCLKDWKVVLDTANGATYQTSPAVFRRWGAHVHVLGDRPDGSNINEGVGSECPDLLASTVIEQKADIGIAHDGDGDRLVVCDETGTIVDGDILLALFAVYAVRSGALKSNTMVATIHSNLGLDHAVSDAGGVVDRVDVGDRNVAQRMRELGSNIGGESSGHIIFSDFESTGDGLLAAVKVIELMLKTGKRLSELREEISLFPQATCNLVVSEKLPLSSLSTLRHVQEDIELEFGANGRVLIRYSGTEPKLRMLVEGRDLDTVKDALSRLESAARKDLSVIDS